MTEEGNGHEETKDSGSCSGSSNRRRKKGDRGREREEVERRRDRGRERVVAGKESEQNMCKKKDLQAGKIRTCLARAKLQRGSSADREERERGRSKTARQMTAGRGSKQEAADKRQRQRRRQEAATRRQQPGSTMKTRLARAQRARF